MSRRIIILTTEADKAREVALSFLFVKSNAGNVDKKI